VKKPQSSRVINLMSRDAMRKKKTISLKKYREQKI
jgi:hypothetical protein